MHQNSRRRSVGLVRRLQPRRMLLVAVAALSLTGATITPAPARAQDALYMSCVDAVAEWYDNCSLAARTIDQEAGCLLAGVIGIIGCAVIEAIKILGGSVGMPAEA